MYKPFNILYRCIDTTLQYLYRVNVFYVKKHKSRTKLKRYALQSHIISTLYNKWYFYLML